MTSADSWNQFSTSTSATMQNTFGGKSKFSNYYVVEECYLHPLRNIFQFYFFYFLFSGCNKLSFNFNSKYVVCFIASFKWAQITNVFSWIFLTARQRNWPCLIVISVVCKLKIVTENFTLTLHFTCHPCYEVQFFFWVSRCGWFYMNIHIPFSS